MKSYFLIAVVFMVFLGLVTACQPATQQSSPQTQPEGTDKLVDEHQDGAYPGPVEVLPVEKGSEDETDPVDALEPGYEQPYPPPDSADPVEQPPFEIKRQHEFSPVAGDATLELGNAFINSSELLILESFPVQVKLVISGDLPTPCHHLRVAVSPPDDDNQIQVAVYSVNDPEMICTQVLASFDATIPIGDFTSGSYRVLVNDSFVGTIDLP